MTKLTLPKLEPTIDLSLWKDHVGENFDPWKLTCPLSFWPQDTPLNFNISKNDGMSHKQFIPTKDPQKWPPFVVKKLPSNSLGFSLTAFSAANPPRLDYHLQVHGKSAAVVTRCSTERAWNNAPLLLPRATWKWDVAPEKIPGKKKGYGFLAGEGFEGFFWGLRQRKSGSATWSLFFGSWNWNILKTSDSFCYKSSFSSTC